MNNAFDPITIIFILLAVFVIYRLRSVLGRRTGAEPPSLPRINPANPASGDGGNVVPLPTANGLRPANGVNQPPPADRWKGVAEADGPVAAGLDALSAADRSFDASAFLNGAKAAYEMIVVAFAKGDRRSLRDLLSKDVFDGFVGVIGEREARGETVETTFVSIDKADLTDAQMKAKVAQLTVRFVSKIITATRDKAGVVIEGSAEKVTDVTDIWTFARDTSSRDPNWKLVATEPGH